MNTYKVDWGEVKTGQYGTTFKGTFERQDGSKFDATISKKDKNGIDFPDFDQIRAGSTVSGTEWKSPKGYVYIFAPKVAPQGNTGASRGGNTSIARAVEKKNEAIASFQDSKEVSIKLASAMRDAVQLAICELEGQDKAPLASRIQHWRNWILSNWGSEQDVKSPF